MKHHASRPIAAVICSLFLIAAASCDLFMEIFEDKPDEYMVRQIIWKTYTFLDELANAQLNLVAGDKVGAELYEDATLPGEATRSMTMTITAYGVTDSYNAWYSADAAFDAWSGDGSSPYVELSGTASYTNKLTVDGTRILSGSLDVDYPPDDNTIDHIEFELTFEDNWATGTVTADGQTIELSEKFIPTE